mgnify:CR=1 FL=1
MTSAWVHAAILSLVSFCIITPVNATYEHLSSVSYIACKTYQMAVGDPTCLIGKHYLVSQKKYLLLSLSGTIDKSTKGLNKSWETLDKLSEDKSKIACAFHSLIYIFGPGNGKKFGFDIPHDAGNQFSLMVRKNLNVKFTLPWARAAQRFTDDFNCLEVSSD